MAGPIRISVIANVRNAVKNLGDVDNRISRMVRNIEGSTRKLNKSVGYFGVLGRAAFVTGGRFAFLSAGVAALVPIALKLSAALAPTAGILTLMPALLLGGASAIGVFKLATSGMSDAIETGLTGTMEEFQKSMKDFGPNMKRFATGIVGLKTPFLELRKLAGESFFGKFADSISGAGKNLDLADAYLPMFRKSVPKIAGAMGGMVNSVIETLISKDSVSSIKSVMDGTAKGITNASVAVKPLVKGFLDLAKVGSSYLPKLGTAVGNLGAKFGKWMSDAAKSGKALQWIESALAAFKTLGSILGNIGSIIKSFYKAANSGGNTVLATVDRLTGRWAKFLSSAEGSDKLKNLFRDLSTLVGAFGDGVLAAALPLIGMFAKTAAGITKDLIPAVQSITKYFQENEGQLKLLVGAFIAFKVLIPIVRGALILKAAALGTAKVATALYTAAMWAGRTAMTAYVATTRVMSAAMVAYGVQAKLTTVAQRLWTAALSVGPLIAYGVQLVTLKATQLAMSVGAKVAAAAQWIWNAALSANPIGLVVLAVAALVGGIVWLATKTKFFQTIWGGLTKAFNATLNWVKSTWPKVREFLSAPITAAGNWISGQWTKIKLMFTGGITAVKNAFNGVKDWFVNIGRDIMNGLKGGIEDGFQWIKDKVGALGSMMPDWLKQVLGIASPSKVFAKLGMQTIDGFAKGFTSISGKQIVADLSKSLTRTTIGAPAFATPSFGKQDSAAAAIAAAGTGGNVYNITVTVPVTADLSTVGDDIIKAVRAYEGKRGQQFLVTRGAN